MSEVKKAELKKGRVLGIGGVFFKSAEHKELKAWYETHLGFKPDPVVSFNWQLPGDASAEHSTTWAVFPATSKYFGEDKQQLMMNYIVDDLDAIMARLEAEGVKIDPKRDSAEFGKFGWIFDADGNKIELWEPAKS